jgi:hypothetical protein
MFRAVTLFGGLFVVLAPTEAAVLPKESAGTLNWKLRGEWKGGACQGTWTFRADGTCELKHYSPGNNTLSGTWATRWTAKPATLGVTITKSDRPEDVGTKWELRIVQLDDETLTYQYTDGSRTRFERVKK